MRARELVAVPPLGLMVVLKCVAVLPLGLVVVLECVVVLPLGLVVVLECGWAIVHHGYAAPHHERGGGPASPTGETDSRSAEREWEQEMAGARGVCRCSFSCCSIYGFSSGVA